MPHAKSTKEHNEEAIPSDLLVPFVCGLFRKSKVVSSPQFPNPIHVISVIRGQNFGCGYAAL
jgi:hypothetical protein